MAGYDGLHPTFAERLQRLNDACGTWIVSGRRSSQEQQELYDLYLAGEGNPANPPGSSNHEATPWGEASGLAADIGGDLPTANARAAEFDLHFPIGSIEPWHCVDVATEILTDEGWKTYDAVAPGDIVLTLNPESRVAEWQPVLAVIRQPAERRLLLSMEGQSFSSLTTAEHRWLVWRQLYSAGRRSARVPAFTTSASGFRAEDAIPLAAPVSGLNAFPKYEDALVELVVWYWTGGTDYNASQVVLNQSETAKSKNVARIRRTLTDVFGSAVASLRPGRFLIDPAWREDTILRAGGPTDETAVDVHFTLNSAAGAILRALALRRVPSLEFISALTPAQLRLFLEVSVLGDGCEYGTRRFLSQARKEPLDLVQMVAAMLGIPTNLRQQQPNMWSLSLLTQEVVRPAQLRKTWVSHDGPVWCVTTPNGTWFARRRGTTYFTGNCQPIEVPFAYYTGIPSELGDVPGGRPGLLCLDARGQAVVECQQRLNVHGFPCDVDGWFGEDTKTAVIGLQTAAGLEADGVVGKDTWALLDGDPLSAEPPPPPPPPLPSAGRTPPNELRLSSQGAAMIAELEGKINTLYNDPANHCTVGIGHLVHKGPICGCEAEAPFVNGLSDEEVYRLFIEKDAPVYEDHVRRLITVPLFPSEFDALVSFTFNLGGGALEESTLRKVLNEGNYPQAADEFSRWVFADGKVLDGLVARRQREADLFKSQWL